MEKIVVEDILLFFLSEGERRDTGMSPEEGAEVALVEET